MIRLLGWALIVAVVLLLGGVIAQMMLADPGVVMIAWNGWLLEMTFWTAVGLGLVLLLTLLVVQRVWRVSAPTRIWQRFRDKRDQKAAKKETLIAFNAWLQGQDDRAILALQRVAKAGGSDRLPRAMTLALGWQQGDWQERQAQLMLTDPELTSFVWAMTAERFWQQGHMSEFLGLFEQHDSLRQVVWLRERYWQALLTQGQFKTLIETINQAPLMEPSLRSAWLEKAGVGLLKASADASALKSLLKQLPKEVKQSLPFVLAQIEFECRHGQHELAWKQAKALAQQQGIEPLLPIWSRFDASPQQQLTLLEQHETSSPSALYCRVAGQVSLASQLWGQAQNWLEKAWAAHDIEAGLALAELFEQRNMPDQAHRVYKQIAHYQKEYSNDG